MKSLNEKNVLNLNKIRSNFRMVSDNGLTLICPKKNFWDWEEGDRWLRSVVVDKDGVVVSCGWPKFGNYGEFQTDTDTINAALAHGNVLFT